MKIMAGIMKKIMANGTMDAKKSWWVSELLAADCKEACIAPRMGKYDAAMARMAAGKKKHDDKMR